MAFEIGQVTHGYEFIEKLDSSGTGITYSSIAFARTGSKGTVTVLADGTTAPEENRELFVFQKEDGVWKIARYMFNKTS